MSSNPVLFTARTHTTGGRAGSFRSADGRLDIRLSPPGTGGADVARGLVGMAHATCPYSKPVRGKIAVAINLV
jgi:organic hydroperoxide reductase OsmC/OhrA